MPISSSARTKRYGPFYVCSPNALTKSCDNPFFKAQVAVGYLLTAKSFLREFGIKHNRYGFCRAALVRKITIPLPLKSCSGGMVSYPKLTNQPLRYSHFHRSENAFSKL